jgi:IS30 family transposase
MQFDLGDFQSLAKKNAGNRYLLLGVDVLSRQMYGAPTKSKRPKDMIQAFEEVFKQLPFLAESIYTDRGSEFVAKEMKQYFEEKGIDKYEAKSSAIKAAVVERAIRTLKNRFG